MAPFRNSPPTRGIWDLAAVILVVVSCVLVTYQFAFQHRVYLIGSVVIYLIDAFFLIDWVRNRRTGDQRPGSETAGGGDTAGSSRRGTSTLDLLGNTPFDALALPWLGFTVEGISFVLFVRLLRVLRVARLIEILRAWQRRTSINVGYLRIGKLLLTVIVVCLLYTSDAADDFAVV